MNATQKQAIEIAIGNAQDNLMRAQMQKKSNPSWKSINGETIDEVIAGYQKHLDELKA